MCHKIITFYTLKVVLHFATDDGRVFACGNNDKGQLGIGNTKSTHTPTLVIAWFLVENNQTINNHDK